MKTRWLFRSLVLAAVACLALASCYKEENTYQTPTEVVICVPPSSVPAVVSPLSCGAQECVASYSASSPDLKRWTWQFTAGSPPESSTPSGQVAFPRPTGFPVSYAWSLTVCGCSAADDATGVSCRGTSGRVTFSSAG